MPHVNIKHFPVDLTDEQVRQLAESVTRTITETFQVSADVVSIALEPVVESAWEDRVSVPEIAGRAHLLIRRPSPIDRLGSHLNRREYPRA